MVHQRKQASISEHILHLHIHSDVPKMYYIALIFIFSTVSGFCCHPDIYSTCDDCSRGTPCCGQNRCNFFCCNCNCRKLDHCKPRCSLQSGLKSKRSIAESEWQLSSTLPNDAKKIVRLLDKNNDTMIDQREMIDWFVTKTNVSQQYLLHQFNSIDANGDFLLSVDEIDPPMNIYRQARSIRGNHGRFVYQFRKKLPSPRALGKSVEDRMGFLEIIGVITTLTEIISFASDLWKKLEQHDDGANHVVLRLTKAPYEMCAIEVEISSASYTNTQIVPPIDKYSCNSRPFELYDARFFSKDTITEHELHFTKIGGVTNITLRALGYTPLLLNNFCFLMDRFVTTAQSGGTLCLDTKFFQTCASYKIRQRDQYKKMVFQGFIVIGKGSDVVNTVEITNVQEFMTVILDIKSRRSANTDEESFKKLCSFVFLHSEKNDCSEHAEGCPCKNGLILPNKCKKHSRGVVFDTVLNEIPFVKDYLGVIEDVIAVKCKP